MPSEFLDKNVRLVALCSASMVTKPVPRSEMAHVCIVPTDSQSFTLEPSPLEERYVRLDDEPHDSIVKELFSCISRYHSSLSVALSCQSATSVPSSFVER